MHSLTSPLEQAVPADHISSLNGDEGKVSSRVTIFGKQFDFKERVLISCRSIGRYSVQASQTFWIATQELPTRSDYSFAICIY